MSKRIQTGDSEEVIAGMEDAGGNPLTGLVDVSTTVRRKSDNFYFDFDPGELIFKGSGWVQKATPMTEIDAVSAAGDYSRIFVAPAADTYYFRPTSPSAFNVPQHLELVVGGFIDNLDFASSSLVRSATPANLLQVNADGEVTVSNLATGSAAISKPAESASISTGSEGVTTFSNTFSQDGIYHEITDDAGVTDMFYQFDIGGNGVPTDVTIIGRVNGNNDDLVVSAWNWSLSQWDVLGDYPGQASGSDTERSFTLFTTHVGTGVNLGKVRVRFNGTGLSSSTLFVDRLFLGFSIVFQSVGYEGGAVHVNTNTGVAGTELFVNGVADNPVSNLADALTIATNMSFKKLKIIGNSTILLVSSMDNFLLEGVSSLWTLDLNAQSFSGGVVIGSSVSGTYTGAIAARFERCDTSNMTLAKADFERCKLGAKMTLSEAADIHYHQCSSNIAGPGRPVIDYGASVGNNNVMFRAYSGGIEVENMGQAGTDLMSIEGFGQLVINANCLGGTIHIRGMFEITDNSEGRVTIVQDALFGKEHKDNLVRVLGLAQENYGLDNVSVNDDGLMTAGRIRTYSVGGSVGTDNDVSETYLVSATYDTETGKLLTYGVVQQ